MHRGRQSRHRRATKYDRSPRQRPAGRRQPERGKQNDLFGLTDCYNPHEPTAQTIMHTNALPLGGGAQEAGIFPLICRINHSCRPNAYHAWNATTGKEMIHASSPIEQGEEIFITYIEPYRARHARRAELQMKFKFICECSLCSVEDSTENDARREEIAALDNLLISLGPRDPISAFGTAKRLLRCIENEDEGAITWLSRSHYDIYQICIGSSDKAAAERHAKLSYAFRLLCEGPTSPATKDMLGRARDPASHPAAGMFSQKLMPSICDACSQKHVTTNCDGCNCAMYCWRVGRCTGSGTSCRARHCRRRRFE